ncbi:MAG: 50S ribosomal protein L17 [Dehalococcoidia bacterium]|nr:50S ribosomal protein L17 [Dehalococcoidia bacterium]
MRQPLTRLGRKRLRHSVKGRQLSREGDTRQALFRNLVTDFLRHGKVVTTVEKAKEIKPMAERVITLARGGSLHQRRQAAAFLTDASVVRTVFSELGPRFKTRNGGYTRIVRLGPRKGDAAEMATLELVE